jgi:threo-3-hydroxy-L-aspartate ammonia-lyase
MIELDDVRAAAARLEGVATRTPVLTSRTLDALTGARVYLKAENFQRGGAFKFRGAYNAIVALAEHQRRPGVAAFSSGNHAQAVALAARLLDAEATIVMPADSPPAKLEATRGYGAQVVLYDRDREDREAIAHELADQRGLTIIPPYDHPLVMAGQGTLALELFEEVGDLDVLLVCVGGGGLIAGCATVAKALHPRIRVYGVEPAAGDDTKRSLDAGERVRIAIPRTIADGQQAETPGRLTFEVNRRRVDDVLLVSDEQILAAMAFLFDRCKVVTEPSGACAVAAVLAGATDLSGRRVGVTISGGNVGLRRFCSLLATC